MKPVKTIKKLRRARRMKNLAIKELSALSGVHGTMISWIEAGRFVPSEDQLARLAKALGFPADRDIWILWEDDPCPDPPRAPKRTL